MHHLEPEKILVPLVYLLQVLLVLDLQLVEINLMEDFTHLFFLKSNTVKFLNFWTPENFAVIKLKFKRPNIRVFCQKDTNGIANSVEPDQTAPHCLRRPICPKI